MTQVLSGNTQDGTFNATGWFVGHFINPPDDPRSTNAVEIKWYTHPAGESKPAWTKSVEATSLAILIRGRFQYSFPERNILLTRQGDYVLWTADVFHTWHAEEESVILTIRWPSKALDVVTADEEQSHRFEQDRSRD